MVGERPGRSFDLPDTGCDDRRDDAPAFPRERSSERLAAIDREASSGSGRVLGVHPGAGWAGRVGRLVGVASPVWSPVRPGGTSPARRRYRRPPRHRRGSRTDRGGGPGVRPVHPRHRRRRTRRHRGTLVASSRPWGVSAGARRGDVGRAIAVGEIDRSDLRTVGLGRPGGRVIGEDRSVGRDDGLPVDVGGVPRVRPDRDHRCRPFIMVTTARRRHRRRCPRGGAGAGGLRAAGGAGRRVLVPGSRDDPGRLPVGRRRVGPVDA